MDEKKSWDDFVARYHNDVSFARQVNENPVKVLKDEGVAVPDGIKVEVVKNEPKKWHLVIPAAVSEISEEDLKSASGGFTGGLCSIWNP